jgi:hypothetical protein
MFQLQRCTSFYDFGRDNFTLQVLFDTVYLENLNDTVLHSLELV